MNDKEKTRDELIKELVALRRGNNPINAASDNYFNERDETETAPNSSEQNYLNLTESLQEGIIIVNPEGQFIYANRYVKELLGYSSQELFNTTLKDLADPREYNKLIKWKHNWIAGQLLPNKSEIVIRRKDGNSFTADVTVSKTKWKDQNCDLIVIQNTTERKITEKAIKESEENFRALVENSLTGVFKTKTNGEIIYVNESILRMLEFDNIEEIINSGAFIRYKYPEQRREMVELLTKNGRLTGFEATILTKNGNERVFMYSLVLDGEIIHGTLIDITKRVEIENALKVSEEINRLLYENSGDAILFTIPDGTVLSANPEACKILGRSEADIMKLGRSEIIDMKDPRLPDALELRKRTGQFKGELNMLRNNGTIFPAEISSTLFKDSLGDERTSLTFRDITERKRMEEELRLSKRELSTLMNNLPGMVYTCLNDTNWTLKFINEGSFDLTGYLLDELIESKTISYNEIIHPDDQKRVWEIKQLFIEKSETYDLEYRIVSKSGKVKYVWDRGQAIYTTDNQLSHLEGFITEITDRKNMEDALRKSQLLLKASLECQRDTILFSIDQEYKYLYFNTSHSDVMKYAYQKDIVLGMNILDCITSYSDRIVAKGNYDRAFRGESHSNIRIYGDVNKAYYESYFNPIINDKNEIVGATGLARDISDRIEKEMKIDLQNEELRNLNITKDKFFSIIAHDLKSPFSSFLGLTQIMAEDLLTLSMTDLQKMAENLNRTANNLYRLLENLLQWSQIQRGIISFRPQLIQLELIVDESIGMINESAKIKNIEITSSNLKGIDVFADAHMLQSIMRNLLSNAVKFTRNGGKVSIAAKLIDSNKAEISLKDTGIGMDQSIIDNLFKIDVQTNRKGTEGEPSTGLGLTICKEFIDMHGGKIWIESEESIGSTFYFTLPNKSVLGEKKDISAQDQENRIDG